MKYEILDKEIQSIVLTLDEKEFVQAEAGSMFFMDESISMDVRVPGGWVGGLKRMFMGESILLPVFTATKNSSRIGFAPPYPARIIKLDIHSSSVWLAQKDSFLFSCGNIFLNIAFIKKLRAGIFGGEGFILQKFTGEGNVFINACGSIIERTLGENETILVDTGSIVAFAESVTYDVKGISGFKAAMFSGEGLFLSTLKGPGKIILQSLPWTRFRSAIFGSDNVKGPLSGIGSAFGGG